MRVVLLHDSESSGPTGTVIGDQTYHDSPIVIGSDGSAHVHLPDLRIPLEHARLTLSHSGQWQVEATAPSTTTLVNGNPIDKRCPRSPIRVS